MGSERRRSERFTVVNLELYSHDFNKRVGQVVDISEGGLMVYSTIYFEINSIQKFRVPFNRTINNQVNFDFIARIAWIKESAPNANLYSVGLEFAENPDVQNHIIKLMINVYGS